MGQGDYDRRTALHLAAAEGHLEVVRFLLVKCKVNPKPQDRYVMRDVLREESDVCWL